VYGYGYEGLPISPIIVEIEIGIGIGIDPCPAWLLALTDRSNFAAKWCQHRNNTVAVPFSAWPNPITRPFDTETDSDPDPDLTSACTFSDGLQRKVLRKGSRIRNLTSPSGSGEPPAEGAVTFSSCLSGWVGSMFCSLLFWGFFSDTDSEDQGSC
ncbi:MAG: hypothetical protein QM518_09415, partial [Verrucomicrobiota bacterium]|nr:hypothetical protein [Verrucomicrobiota bacterium]